MDNSILVTGGAGFIGSNFVLDWFRNGGCRLVNLDKLTYAGNPRNLASLDGNPLYTFVHGDVCDGELLSRLMDEHHPFAVVHFAAESHVDRSIVGPADFIRTNIEGTFALLESTREYWNRLTPRDKERFRLLHVSTDEVFGSLDSSASGFVEDSRYDPSSPYAASKAASDHLVRAYYRTYGVPVLVTNCSNNYGPYQFPEKLIPLMILNALEGAPLPVYGDGENVRDWLYVGDHCEAIRTVLARGRVGGTYNIGGLSERKNRDVVASICDLLDEIRPDASISPRRRLITSVSDRPGHDRRYAIDASKVRRELGWQPRETFETGIRKTIEWYLQHMDWVTDVRSGAYQEWIHLNYASRDQR